MVTKNTDINYIHPCNYHINLLIKYLHIYKKRNNPGYLYMVIMYYYTFIVITLSSLCFEKKIDF